MNGTVAYALTGSKVAAIASGIDHYEVEDQTLKIFTLDGTRLDMVFPLITIDEIKIDDITKHLIFKMVDGTIHDLGEVNGASAYEIAVKNGFVGTEEEWLDSLKIKINDIIKIQDTKPDDETPIWVDTSDTSDEYADPADPSDLDFVFDGGSGSSSSPSDDKYAGSGDLGYLGF